MTRRTMESHVWTTYAKWDQLILISLRGILYRVLLKVKDDLLRIAIKKSRLLLFDSKLAKCAKRVFGKTKPIRCDMRRRIELDETGSNILSCMH